MGKFKEIEMAELLLGFEVVFEEDQIEAYREVVLNYQAFVDFLNSKKFEGKRKISLSYDYTLRLFFMKPVHVDYEGNNNHTNDLSPERLTMYLEGLRKKVHDLNESVKMDMSYVLDMLQGELRKELRELEVSQMVSAGRVMIMSSETIEAFIESGQLANVRIPQLKLAIQLIKDQKIE